MGIGSENKEDQPLDYVICHRYLITEYEYFSTDYFEHALCNMLHVL